jgi:hypothetical protein
MEYVWHCIRARNSMAAQRLQHALHAECGVVVRKSDNVSAHSALHVLSDLAGAASQHSGDAKHRASVSATAATVCSALTVC